MENTDLGTESIWVSTTTLLWRRNGPNHNLTVTCRRRGRIKLECAFQSDSNHRWSQSSPRSTTKRGLFTWRQDLLLEIVSSTVGYNSVQAGFAFYKRMGRTQPWVIAEISRMPGINDEYDKPSISAVNKDFSWMSVSTMIAGSNSTFAIRFKDLI